MLPSGRRPTAAETCSGSGSGRGLAELGPLQVPTLELGGRRLSLGPVPLAAPLLDLVPPLLHDGIDAKNLLEIAGLGALLPWDPRFAAWPGISRERSEPAVPASPVSSPSHQPVGSPA